ncbi:MAG TPA: SGNH/GDSL hydrolase family protein [Vicinamibacterales bacterium]|jgi:lysophospholipase L1-like esterase
MQVTRRALATAALVTLVMATPFGQARSTGHWVATWTTAVVARPAVLPPAAAPAAPPPPNAPAPGPPPITPNNQTLREIVHTSVGGTRARVVFANTFGTSAMNIGGASIALRDRDSAIVPASLRKLTVNGSQAFRIPAGATVLTDAVDLPVPARADLAIDVFVPDDLGSGPSLITFHNGANQTSYASATGNHVGETAMEGGAITRSWFLLSRVEVAATPRVGVIAAFGDSITDGTRSTPDTNNRWPDHLARRVGATFAVANVAIAGNRVLTEGNAPGGFGGNAGVNALARFDRDVLAQPGVTHVVVMEGINDIGAAQAAVEDLIAAHRQLVERAHARGLKIYGATLTPYEGAAYFSQEGEAKRKALNQWIRTSGMYDAVIDFESVIRDPAAPTKMRAEFDSGDHLHPNDAGYKAMGESVELSLFKPSGS